MKYCRVMYLADQTMSSDLSIELSLQEEPHPLNHSVFMQEEEEEDQDDDEEELPSFLQQDNKSERNPLCMCMCICIFLANALIYLANEIWFPEPLSISEGLCVWCKLRKYPYWPAVVSTAYDFVQFF